ncbi:MAG: hypothetical protein NZ888_02435 [Candidatus Nitrosocaldus sp.]|nr:hypothetical protein [Candidatus Nitrosocaldus sp.]MDW7999896.1 hypothetical protein [Candidatus Nitrosocaldus sp.]
MGVLLAIALITAVVALIVGINTAYASHYSGYRWALTYTNACYDSYSLNNVNIDGSTGRYSLVASEIDQARNDWNNLPSVFTINRVNSCNNWITAASFNASFLARTFFQQQGGYLVDVDTEINSYYRFSSSGRCTTPPYTLDYVMRHEFGHWVMFNDVWYTSPSSVMYGGYDCNRWNSIKSYDSNELSSIYG